jgi:hypothetical protein
MFSAIFGTRLRVVDGNLYLLVIFNDLSAGTSVEKALQYFNKLIHNEGQMFNINFEANI